jgi:phosphonate transport system substrate-binding protein
LLLQNGQVDIAFICGLPLIRHNRVAEQPMRILAAPVMLGDRYQNQPIYFADIVVNADSKLARFEDLEGTRFCYNDRGSNSGYNLLRDRLLQHLQPNHLHRKFFSSTQQSGSHQNSLQWVANRLADCAAIDSVVMEAELRQIPELAQSLRIIDSIKSPMPPIAVASCLDSDLMEQLRNVILEPDQELQAAMSLAQVKHYVQVTDIDYEPIAIAYDAAIQAGYEAIA